MLHLILIRSSENRANVVIGTRKNGWILEKKVSKRLQRYYGQHNMPIAADGWYWGELREG